jgi:hypothetical protein
LNTYTAVLLFRFTSYPPAMYKFVEVAAAAASWIAAGSGSSLRCIGAVAPVVVVDPDDVGAVGCVTWPALEVVPELRRAR